MSANALMSMAIPHQPPTDADAANPSRVGISSWSTTPDVPQETASTSVSALFRTLTLINLSSTIRPNSGRLDVQERASQLGQPTSEHQNDETYAVFDDDWYGNKKITSKEWYTYCMETPWIGDEDIPGCHFHAPGDCGVQESFRVLDSSLELAAGPNLPSARGASMPMMTVFWSLRGEEGRLQLEKQLSLSSARPVEPVIWDGLMDAPSLQLVIGSINTRHRCSYGEQRRCWIDGALSWQLHRPGTVLYAKCSNFNAVGRTELL